MAATYHGLGFDPTPGDPDSVAQASAQLTAAAEHVAQAEPAVLRATAAAERWHGAGGDAFGAHLAGVPQSLAERPARLRAAAGALDEWSQVLVAHKRRTEELDRVAVRLRAALTAAQDELQDTQNVVDLAATPSAAASASVQASAAARQVGDLEKQLTTVLGQAHELAGEHRAAADQVVAALSGGPVTDPASHGATGFGRPLRDALGRGSTIASGLATALGGTPGRPRRAPTGAAGALAASLGGRR